jgi:dTMP kinase
MDKNRQISEQGRKRKGPAGLLIAFEGIDGTGKTTQVRMLCEALKDLHCDVVQTREPTDGRYGKQIRMLYKCRDSVTPEKELELFLADRGEHVEQVINPALLAGRIVVTDRYYYSTAAYQGAMGNDPELIIRRNEEFAPVPDLVFLLEAPVKTGIHRVEKLRREDLNDFEQEDTLTRVSVIFSQLHGANIIRIDGTQSAAEVHRSVMNQIFPLLRSFGCGG